MIVIATPIDGAELDSADVKYGYLRARLSMPDRDQVPVVAYADDIVRARNRVAATVLREYGEATHVLWWDSDTWPEDVGCVARMVYTGADVVGAPYCTKAEPCRWVHAPLEPAPPACDGLQEVRAVGFGFTLTSLNCLRRMSAPARKYADWPRGHRVANIFGQTYERVAFSDDPSDEVLSSEDFSFCARWRAAGERVYIYTGAGNVWHAGTKANCLRRPM